VGAGKTELLKWTYGLLGAIWELRLPASVGLVPEDRKRRLFLDLDIAKNISISPPLLTRLPTSQEEGEGPGGEVSELDIRAGP
jgi:hypothetical protein